MSGSFESFRDRLSSFNLTWVHISLIWGAILTYVWMEWGGGTQALPARTVRDSVVFILGPLALASYYGREIGWRIDRDVVKNTVLLSLFVLPFYIVGSSFPTIREFYPMWSTTTALGDFIPHAIMQFMLALAAETYYRGLLCVGVSEIGFKSVFISPIVYAVQHAAKPPIELLLSGPTDVLFGAVDYKSNSIVPSVVAHGCGLVLLDWLVLHPPILPPDAVASWFSWLPVPI